MGALLLQLLACLAQESSAHWVFDNEMQPFVRRFDESHGLPSLSVKSIAFDSDGRLWVASENGLSRFDGARFETVPVPFASSAVLEKLHVDGEGRLWLSAWGTSSLAVLDRAGLWRTLPMPSGAYINAFCDRGLAEPGALYVGTSAGLVRVVDDHVESLSGPSDKAVRALSCQSEGVWVATEQELYIRAADGSWRVHGASDGVPPDRINALISRRAGGVWFATDTSLFSLVSRAERVDVDAGLSKLVLDIVEFDDGELWAATDYGALVVRSGGRWRAISLGDLQAKVVFKLLRAPTSAEGAHVVFAATDKGLLQIMPNEWYRPRPESVLAKKQVSRFAESRDASVFVLGGDNAEVVVANERRLATVRMAGTVDRVQAFAPGVSGHEVWAGLRSGLVARVEQSVRTEASTRVPDDSIFAMTPLGAGRFLLAQRYGPSVFQAEKHSADSASRASQSKWGRLFASSSVGQREFVGGEDGLFEFVGGKWTSVSMPVAGPVVSLAQAEETLWVGTGGNGALRWNLANGEWSRLSTDTQPAIANGYIDAIAVDPTGVVYLCTEKGVARVGARGEVAHYTRGNGLPSDACIHGGMYVDLDGRVWVATAAGLAVLDPAQHRTYASGSALSFAETRVKDALVVGDAWRRLSHDLASVSFSFSLPSYVRGEDVQYRTQLVGLESAASPWSTRHQREFPTLPAGDYTFSVWARTAVGEDIGPIHSRFAVLPAWWQTPWAYLAYTLAVVAAAFGVMRIRTRQLRARAELLEETVLKRTEEVRQQAAELLAQKEQLERSYQEADRIFDALKTALKGSLLADRYQLEEEIGSGGFGVVYRASEVRTGVAFAVKVFRPQPGNDSAQSLQRFMQEARSGQRLVHDNVVRIHDFGVSKDNVAYMVMELLVGESVKDRLKRLERMSPREVAHVGESVCAALNAAHALGVVHRDIKPDNVFIHRDSSGKEIVKVLDFGVAKLTAPMGSIEIKTLTMTGAVVGTPTYMAPERMDGEESGGPSDVYSVGVMLYELLAGRPPFQMGKGGLLSLIHAHLAERPEPVTQFAPDVPSPLQALVEAALAKKPHERPSAEALGRGLHSVGESLGV